MNLKDIVSRLRSILFSPDRFFSALKERSIGPPIMWYAGGMFLFLFVGGPLSILLSAAFGVPGDKMVGMITGQEPGVQAFLRYALLLSLTWAGSIIAALATAALSYALALLLGADASFVKSVQMMAYCSTPFFFAYALPQVLLMDTLIASPLSSVIAMWWNYSVDFVQYAAMAYSAGLAWVGCRVYYKMGVARTVVFFAIPAAILLFILGGFVVLFSF